MTQSLTGSWTKEITAGYAPPASEETGIRYPCPQRVLKCSTTNPQFTHNRAEFSIPSIAALFFTNPLIAISCLSGWSFRNAIAPDIIFLWGSSAAIISFVRSISGHLLDQAHPVLSAQADPLFFSHSFSSVIAVASCNRRRQSSSSLSVSGPVVALTIPIIFFKHRLSSGRE